MTTHVGTHDTTARSLAWDECYVPELPVGETLAALSTAGGTGRGEA